jgi:hypothetical protein
MPIRIKSASSSQQKYVNNTGNAGQSYTDGINNPRRDWLAATTAAEGTWAQAVQNAVTSGSFGKGLNQDSAAKQKANAIALGVGRYPAGTKNAAGNWAKFTQPVLDAMAAVPDMPRGPKMSQQNFDKQHAYATAAHGAKKNK